MARISVFRLYILGHLDLDTSKKQTLTTLAEYGTARKLVRINVAPKEAQSLVQRIRDLRAYMVGGSPVFDEAALVRLGGNLFDLIIRGEVRTLLVKASATVGFKPQPLEIVVEDSMITGWPWEYLYDTTNRIFLCREYHPISRSSFNLDPLPPPEVKTDAIRILFVLGSTRRDPEMDAAEELDKHKDQFRDLEKLGLVQVDPIEAADPHALIDAFARGSYDILHFYGHAGYDPLRKEGYLRLDTEDEDAQEATDEDPQKTEAIKSHRFYANNLAELLLGSDVRLAFLNACETAVGAKDLDPARSALAAAILARGIPAVIATQYLMPVNTALHFSKLIYGALASGASLVEAMRTGRFTMNFGMKVKHADWGIPVLYAAYPDLVIFPLPESRRKPKQAPAQLAAAE